MNIFDALDVIETTSSTKDKQALLDKYSSSREFKELISAALNYKKKYYVNKFNVGFADKSTISHVDFCALLDKLSSRELTGNAAIAAVEELLCRCSENQAKWYSRIIRRDLKAGFGVDAANKAGMGIPEFEVMLAKDGKEYKKLKESLSKTKHLASPKLDGYRCFAVVDGEQNQVTLYTRNGEVYKNFAAVEESLGAMYFNTGQKIVFDGEIMSDNFNSMQKSAFASKRGTTVGDVKYHIFDCIPYAEYETSQFKMKTFARHEILLYEWSKGLSTYKNLVLVDQVTVKTEDEILELEKHYISLGYEGVMVKPDIAYYMGKKTGGMMKFKTMLSMDCEVVGMYEGEGRNAGRMGGLTVIQEDNSTRCDVGSGFSDEDRVELYSNQAEILGRLAEIKYQELTPDGVMRFPIFMRWRDSGKGTKKK